jgi:hypothetical protein
MILTNYDPSLSLDAAVCRVATTTLTSTTGPIYPPLPALPVGYLCDTLSYFYELRSLKSMAGDLDPIVHAKTCCSTILECRVDGRLNVVEKLFLCVVCVCHGAVHVRLDRAWRLLAPTSKGTPGLPGDASTHHHELFSLP